MAPVEQDRLGDLRELSTLVIHIDERPPPEVGHAAHHLHICLGHRSRCRAGNFGGSCGIGTCWAFALKEVGAKASAVDSAITLAADFINVTV